MSKQPKTNPNPWDDSRFNDLKWFIGGQPCLSRKCSPKDTKNNPEDIPNITPHKSFIINENESIHFCMYCNKKTIVK